MKILIADDDAVMRQLLTGLLGKWGHDVAEARDGEEAWRIVEKDAGIRLGILDWFMPELSGIQLTKRIRDNHITPFHVILITMRGGKENLIEALDAGANDFLSKPFDRDVLDARLRVGIRQVELQTDMIQRIVEARAAIDTLQALDHFIPFCRKCGAARALDGTWHKRPIDRPQVPAPTGNALICPDCERASA